MPRPLPPGTAKQTESEIEIKLQSDEFIVIWFDFTKQEAEDIFILSSSSAEEVK